MIEQRVITYLSAELGLPVYAEVPEQNVGEFLVVEKTGSFRENYLDTANIIVQSYAGSLLEAAVINDSVKAAMFRMIHEEDISDVRLNSDYNYTDTATRRYRYQAVFVVIYY